MTTPTRTNMGNMGFMSPVSGSFVTSPTMPQVMTKMIAASNTIVVIILFLSNMLLHCFFGPLRNIDLIIEIKEERRTYPKRERIVPSE
jgi:hypothetical protein